jgi:DNA-binding transcriptional MerR regulator
MGTMLNIGDFARMTFLSVKALRHYHEVGLLAPAEVDPESGYRRYALAQVPKAQVIRRLRELGMPIDDVRSVAEAPIAQRLSRRSDALRSRCRIRRGYVLLALEQEFPAAIRLTPRPSG